MRRRPEIRRRAPLCPPPSGVPPLLARLYAHRGVSSLEETDLSLRHLLPVTALDGAAEGAVLLADLIEADGRILVVGDFDADGATATALALRGLRALGARQVDYLVPNRFAFGYGLTPELVQVARELRPDLILTVDNGISSVEGVAAARAAAIRVLVTDHHLPGATLPEADVLLNPNLPDNGFPSGNLAGVGVMFYLLAALRAELRARGRFGDCEAPNLAQWLDLVALGTVADVVPLDRNNRILVSQGLQRIRQGACVPGIRALAEVAGRRLGTLDAADLGFALGPRLNAAGRLEDMALGIECLLCDDPGEALRMAQELDALNRARREIEAEMKEQAEAIVAGLGARVGRDDLPHGLCLFEPGWHEGVVGIVAARIREQVHRPVIAFAETVDDPTLLKGSARSIPGVHVRDVLERVSALHPGLLGRFGGHAMAAGLSLPRDRLDDFEAAFDAAVAELARPEDLQPVVWSDGALPPEALSLETAELLRSAGPWGKDFPEPLFDGVFEVLERRIVGEKHLKLVLRDEAGRTVVDAIQFFHHEADWPEGLRRCQLAYRLSVNEWRGQRALQLMIEVARPLE